MLPFANYYISTPIMSEKKNITRSSSNRRKKRWSSTLFTAGGGGGGEDDDLAAVKAAAWAWYQRHEGKPMMREFDLTTRSTRTPRPSRYKLEANKNMMIMSENRVSKPLHTSHLCRGDQETKLSSLLDSYEIKSISKRIDEGSLPTKQGSSLRHDHVLLEKKFEYDHSNKEMNGLVNKMSIRNLWKGMSLMAPRTVCGRSDDVDLRAYRTEKVSRRRSVSTRTDGG
ncbi:hypothetical protein CARUB_v10007598mg [Capsella rubella]|uniref:Uncharacterized protein n=1 Tax=Capsella rubella TaxID=81985 RepID=R0H608_9BRAS|nr:uncharacterized protein LOC17880644 [Capsella rubella]EOA18963.1 hypothetical protein CARUB_v10007598mg [Capsella rubella]